MEAYIDELDYLTDRRTFYIHTSGDDVNKNNDTEADHAAVLADVYFDPAVYSRPARLQLTVVDSSHTERLVLLTTLTAATHSNTSAAGICYYIISTLFSFDSPSVITEKRARKLKDGRRYRAVHRQLRCVVARTPTCVG